MRNLKYIVLSTLMVLTLTAQAQRVISVPRLLLVVVVCLAAIWSVTGKMARWYKNC